LNQRKNFPPTGHWNFLSRMCDFTTWCFFFEQEKTRLAFVILAWKATTMIPPAASDYASITYYQQLFSCNDFLLNCFFRQSVMCLWLLPYHHHHSSPLVRISTSSRLKRKFQSSNCTVGNSDNYWLITKIQILFKFGPKKVEFFVILALFLVIFLILAPNLKFYIHFNFCLCIFLWAQNGQYFPLWIEKKIVPSSRTSPNDFFLWSMLPNFSKMNMMNIVMISLWHYVLLLLKCVKKTTRMWEW